MHCSHFNLPGGGTAIICGRDRLKACAVCGLPSAKLCDFPLTGVKAGKTCDRPVCEKCAVHSEPDTDYCPTHARMIEQPTCAFCSEAAEARCGWKGSVPTPVRADEVLHGDVLWMFPGRLCGKVTAIEPRGEHGLLRLTYWLARIRRESWIHRHITAEVYVDRPGACKTPCCAAHSREVRDGLHYCSEHWGAWEAVQ